MIWVGTGQIQQRWDIVDGDGVYRSDNGGETFSIVRSSPGGDDYHALWIDSEDSRRLITGADQGAIITHNGGASWSSWYNQPTGQFYRLAVDEAFPYRIYSGQQDSGTVRIASRSDYGQLTFRDWNPVGGHERDGDIPDPKDASIVYGAGLGGYLSRWNEMTWQTISPDLTGIVEGEGDCEGDVAVQDATACGYGTIFAISPSPVEKGLIWVGTTNGLVQLTRDEGASWQEVTPSDLQDWTKVNHVDASPMRAGTAYIAADGHRRDDYDPIAFRTHDYGATWTEIGHGLPPGQWIGVVRQDPLQEGLLNAGTSRGVHVSFDDGDHWQSLQLDLPTTGINDLLVHRDDLIVATEGRAILILDDVSPLRHLAEHHASPGPTLVAPAKAWRLRFNQNQDTPLPPEEPRGENPPAGAILDYVLPPGADLPVEIEILDAAGEQVRRFRSDDEWVRPQVRDYVADLWIGQPPLPETGPGHHRFAWDLRYPAPKTLRSSYSIAAVPGKATPIRPEGAFVLPGRYRVRMTYGGVTLVQGLEVVLDTRLEVSLEELSELLEFQRQVGGVLEEVVNRAEAEDDEDLRSIAGALTGLLSSLESVDESPTPAQRDFLAHEQERLGAYIASGKS